MKLYRFVMNRSKKFNPLLTKHMRRILRSNFFIYLHYAQLHMFISRTRQSIGHRNGIILKTLFSSIQKNSIEKDRPMSSLDQFFPSNIHPFLYILTCYIHPLLKKILIFDVKRKSKIVDRYSLRNGYTCNRLID